MPKCSLPGGFHALEKKSMELLFQVWRKLRTPQKSEEFVWWSPCSDSVKKVPSRRKQVEREIPASRIPCGPQGPGFFGVGSGAALITRCD